VTPPTVVIIDDSFVMRYAWGLKLKTPCAAKNTPYDGLTATCLAYGCPDEFIKACQNKKLVDTSSILAIVLDYFFAKPQEETLSPLDFAQTVKNIQAICPAPLLLSTSAAHVYTDGEQHTKMKDLGILKVMGKTPLDLAQLLSVLQDS